MSKHEPKDVSKHEARKPDKPVSPEPPRPGSPGPTGEEPPPRQGLAPDDPEEAKAPDGQGQGPRVEVENLQDVLAGEEFTELAALRAELEDAKDRALRFGAELENYKRRVARQVEEERRYANVALLRDLLPVYDNMGRAIQSAQNAAGASGLLEGVQLVHQQLRTVFEKHDCKEIEAQGTPFDPNLHQAISQRPTGDAPPGTVVEVAQPGFQVHDRVVRPSQVIVSTAPTESQ